MALLGLAMLCGAQSGPQPPCGNEAFPPYPDLDHSPSVKTWDRDQLSRDWTPPACSGWTSPGYLTLVVTTARFRNSSGFEDLLRHIGAISDLKRIRYWSTTKQAWQALIVDASSLDGRTGEHRRKDFSLEEMKEGQRLYFLQQDTITGKAIYQMSILAASPDRIVFAIENITTMKVFLVPIFHPGDLQSIYFLDRESPDVWRYYNLVRTGKQASGLAAGHLPSSINRAVAFYRHLAGIPTDQEPPAAR